MGELIDRDQEHLRLLRLGFFVLAGFTSLFSLVSLFYIGLGTFVTFGNFPVNEGRGADQLIASMMLAFGVVFLLSSVVGSLLTYFAGRSLGERRHRIFCMVMAGLWCLCVPFGTMIGVGAILVLNRPSVQELFESAGVPPPIPHSPST